MELGAARWVLLFGQSSAARPRRVSVTAGDLARVQREIAAAKVKFGLPPQAPVVSCYEAGRDGFWIHRWLCSIGVDSRVVDSASIEVSQRAKRVKTDRVDVEKLLKLLMRACGGEPNVWRELRVPSLEQEDHRRLHRERERLQKECGALGSRIGSLLATMGVRVVIGRHFEQQLAQLRCWNGDPLPAHLAAEIARMWQRCSLLDEQLLAQAQPHTQQARELMQLRAIGLNTGWVLSAEVFGWRDIRNRRQLAGLAGLGSAPYDSGGSQRDQGISGAGNRRVRSLMVEIAWQWLRLQPHSELARWFERRFGSGGKRSRRIGIVALARKLLVALWRYLHDGVIPAGATLKQA
jgi:transposase